MKPDYDYYNPEYCKGNLPVRVLVNGFTDWFVNTSPEFKQKFNDEVRYNGLKNSISYIMIKAPIRNQASINPDGKIELYENFLQYLWCLCYAFPILYDENIGRNLKAGTSFESVHNIRIDKAISILSNGLGLTKAYANAETVFFTLPNPEKFNEIDKEDIGGANASYIAAVTFILIHEFAHKYLEHLQYEPTNEESKKEELEADDFAITEISYNFTSEKGFTLKTGIIIGLLSLLFLENSIKGGDTHPDFDTRLNRAFEKLEIDDMNPIWGSAGYMLLFWTGIIRKEFTTPPDINLKNLMQTYYNIVSGMKNY